MAESREENYVRFSVAVASTGRPDNIARRVFSSAVADQLWTFLRNRPGGLPQGFRSDPDPVYWSQEGLT